MGSTIFTSTHSARITRLQSRPAAQTNNESLIWHHSQSEELDTCWQVGHIRLLCLYGIDTCSGCEFAFPDCKAPHLVVVLWWLSKPSYLNCVRYPDVIELGCCSSPSTSVAEHENTK